MTMPGLNSLFYRPGGMFIVLQKFLVMIRFDDESVNFGQALDQQLGRIAEIGDKPKPVRSGVKNKTNRINCIMGHRKTLNRDIANRKLGASAKNSPIPIPI